MISLVTSHCQLSIVKQVYKSLSTVKCVANRKSPSSSSKQSLSTVKRSYSKCDVCSTDNPPLMVPVGKVPPEKTTKNNVSLNFGVASKPSNIDGLSADNPDTVVNICNTHLWALKYSHTASRRYSSKHFCYSSVGKSAMC